MKQWDTLISMRVKLGAGPGFGFSVPDRTGEHLGDAGRHGGALVMAAGPVGARALADELGESGAERTQRRTPDREADLGDREIAAPQQRLRPLDPAGHQVAVRRLAEGGAEAA